MACAVIADFRQITFAIQTSKQQAILIVEPPADPVVGGIYRRNGAGIVRRRLFSPGQQLRQLGRAQGVGVADGIGQPARRVITHGRHIAKRIYAPRQAAIGVIQADFLPVIGRVGRRPQNIQSPQLGIGRQLRHIHRRGVADGPYRLVVAVVDVFGQRAADIQLARLASQIVVQECACPADRIRRPQQAAGRAVLVAGGAQRAAGILPRDRNRLARLVIAGDRGQAVGQRDTVLAGRVGIDRSGDIAQRVGASHHPVQAIVAIAGEIAVAVYLLQQVAGLIVCIMDDDLFAIGDAVALGVDRQIAGRRSYQPARIVSGVVALDQAHVLFGRPGLEIRLGRGVAGNHAALIGDAGRFPALGVISAFDHPAFRADGETQMAAAGVVDVAGGSGPVDRFAEQLVLSVVAPSHRMPHRVSAQNAVACGVIFEMRLLAAAINHIADPAMAVVIKALRDAAGADLLELAQAIVVQRGRQPRGVGHRGPALCIVIIKARGARCAVRSHIDDGLNAVSASCQRIAEIQTAAVILLQAADPGAGPVISITNGIGPPIGDTVVLWRKIRRHADEPVGRIIAVTHPRQRLRLPAVLDNGAHLGEIAGGIVIDKHRFAAGVLQADDAARAIISKRDACPIRAQHLLQPPLRIVTLARLALAIDPGPALPIPAQRIVGAAAVLRYIAPAGGVICVKRVAAVLGDPMHSAARGARHAAQPGYLAAVAQPPVARAIAASLTVVGSQKTHWQTGRRQVFIPVLQYQVAVAGIDYNLLAAPPLLRRTQLTASAQCR
ncbi:hypothetical protein ABH313_12545 [Chromobacterium vaccinii]